MTQRLDVTRERGGQDVRELMSVEGFARIAAMEEAERRLVLRELIAAEYGCEAADSRRLASERLHAWATLARSDLDGARRLGCSFDALFEEQPAEMAMRRAMVVQSVVASEFNDDERALLLEAIPGMRRQVASSVPKVVTARGAPEPTATAEPKPKRTGLGRFFHRN
ncbi:MAG: hypothetical protein AB7T16_08830 [Dehalococcoidia bacterium]